MQIRNSYNINFGSKKLYSADLSDPNSEKTTKAYVSELQDEDKDKIFLYRIKWEKTSYGQKLADAFSTDAFIDDTNVKFLAVECPDLKDDKQIKAMTMVELFDDYIYIDMLQSERELNPASSLNGAGSCLLYSVIKMAENLKKMNVKFKMASKAFKFYAKCGVEKPRNLYFDAIINPLMYCKNMENIQKKYNIKEHNE